MLGISLTISTLHSHHNLELHNSPDFADTGHCLNDYSPLCPICGYLLEGDEIEVVESGTDFAPHFVLANRDQNRFASRNHIPFLGRSPPSFV